MSKLDDILDIEPIKEVVPPEGEPSKDMVILQSNSETDLEADYELARKTYRDLIETGNKSLVQLVQIAQNTEIPRAYEVIATFIKTMSETTNDFYNIQKTKKQIQFLDTDKAGIKVDKAVFVGSPADLLREIKKNR